MSRTGRDIGKKFEKAVETAFDTFKKRYGFNYHKFVDTHAAGNIVAGQPSDYLVTLPSGLCYLEAKASTTTDRLGKSMLRPSQRRTIMMDSQMLGVPYYVLFYAERTKEFHLLDGAEVMRGSRINYKQSLLMKGSLEGLPKFWGLQPLSNVISTFKAQYE